MIRYKNIILKDYIDLLYYFLNRGLRFRIELFPSHKYFYTKAALEAKFSRKFSKKEIKQILNDKSWQWRNLSQTKELLKERRVSLHLKGV
jgi:hypothetical protein